LIRRQNNRACDISAKIAGSMIFDIPADNIVEIKPSVSDGKIVGQIQHPIPWTILLHPKHVIIEEKKGLGEFVRELNKLVMICSLFGKADLLFYYHQ
jgi:hypothetical protein